MSRLSSPIFLLYSFPAFIVAALVGCLHYRHFVSSYTAELR